MITVYLGLFIVLVYTIIMIIKNKRIPPSVSETFYLGGKYWFTIILFISSFLITAGLLDMSEGSNFQFIGFFSGAGMAFVGAAPHFHDREKTVHMVGAITLLLGSQIWLGIFSTPWVYLLWLPAIKWIKSPNYVFWAEMTALISVGIGLLFV